MVRVDMEQIERTFPKVKGTIDTLSEHGLQTIEPYNPSTHRGEYRWGRIGSRMYETFIIFRPSTIIMYGDCGTWVLRQDGIDLAWLRGAICDPTYLLSKTTNDRKPGYDSTRTKKYAEECIDEMAKGELLKDEEGVLSNLRAEYKMVDWDHAEDAYNFFREVLGDSNPEESLRYSWDAAGGRWPWATLYTFLNALEKE